MRDRRNTFEVGEGLLYKGEEERIEQEEQYPEKRDFCFLWCHISSFASYLCVIQTILIPLLQEATLYTQVYIIFFIFA